MTTIRRMLVTAGPTHEPIDAVRYLANRSSGRLGIALAEAARDAGWSVTLLLGPASLAPPNGVAVERFESAADLESLLDEHFAGCDVLIMAAAVADYRPQLAVVGKLPREGGVLTLELEPTPDLVAACAKRKRENQIIIGFALEEPGLLEKRAAKKLRAKGLDAIVANPLETMGAEGVSAMVMTADGEAFTPPAPDAGTTIPKREFAAWLVDWAGSRVDLPPG